MEELTLILFISVAAPLILMLPMFKGTQRLLCAFLILGMLFYYVSDSLSFLLYTRSPLDTDYVFANIVPVIEELFKALPIAVYALLIKPKRQELLECSVAVSVGFAILENASTILLISDITAGFSVLVNCLGNAMMNIICGVAQGYGFWIISIRRKLLVTGSLALLSMVSIYNACYNVVAISKYSDFAFILSLLIFIPVVILIRKKRTASDDNNSLI